MIFEKQLRFLSNRIILIPNAITEAVNTNNKIRKELKLNRKQVSLISLGLDDIKRGQKEFFEHTLRKEKQYEYDIRCTIDRAVDIWGLDFAHSSNGYYPAGNQLGRRPVSPADIGLNSWSLKATKTEELVGDGILDDDLFIVIKGYHYEPKDASLSPLHGVRLSLSRVTLPYIPFGPAWDYDDNGGYTYIYDNASVVSPRSQITMTAFHDPAIVSTMNPSYKLSLVGDIIAKRSYLIRGPSQILGHQENAEVVAKINKLFKNAEKDLNITIQPVAWFNQKYTGSCLIVGCNIHVNGEMGEGSYYQIHEYKNSPGREGPVYMIFSDQFTSPITVIDAYGALNFETAGEIYASIKSHVNQMKKFTDAEHE